MQTTSALQEPSPSLAALRRATAACHQTLESVISLDGDWDLAHYARVLLGFHHYLHAWEPAMTTALPEHFRDDFRARSRMAFLRADLRELAAVIHDTDADSMAESLPAPRLPRLPCVASALGSLYVLEGSALGGQLIARRLLERHGLTADKGGAYFTGWGPRTGAMWQAFRHTLAAEVGNDPQAIDAACRAAIDTFDGLTHTFEVMLNERLATS